MFTTPARAIVSGIWSMLPLENTLPTDNEREMFGVAIASVAELPGSVALLAGAADELDTVSDEVEIVSLLLDGVVDTGLRSSPRTSITFSA